MNRRTRTVAISLALIVLTSQNAFAAGKTAIVIKKAGRATSVTPNTILSGVGVPTKSLGIDGDFYIDIKNANLYGPKTKGLWKIATSLRTTDSRDLVMSTTGADGVRGATGSKGETGATGTNGSKGETGATGTNGSKGETGAMGLTGASGAAGLNGTKGDTGATGAAGLNGVNGVAGMKGEVGVAGSAGLTGLTGAAGTTGAIGLKGDIGLTGSAGTAGSAGAAGISNTYFIDIQSWTLSTSVSSGNSDSSAFGTLLGGGSYSFQLMLDGTFSPVTASSMNIGMQLNATVTPVSLQYRVFSSDASSLINGIGGRHYQFIIMGTIVCGGATTSLTLRAVDQYGTTSANALTLTGKALISKVGTIG